MAAAERAARGAMRRDPASTAFAATAATAATAAAITFTARGGGSQRAKVFTAWWHCCRTSDCC